MPFAFQEPAMLWGAAAAAAPLVAHLVARTRPPRKLFPTVEFLQRAMKRVWRWRKPQDWLLLAVRTLAIGALGLAFPRPVWLGRTDLAGAGAGKHLMLVVDRSASMLAVEDGQSRFSLATSRALEALRSAGKLDSVNLVWLDANPEAVYARMGRAVQPLETALRDARVMGARGDAAAAIRVALEKLSEVSGTQELVVISDFQTETWSGTLPQAPANVQVIPVRIGSRDLPNLAMAGIDITPAAPFVGETLSAVCSVRNAGPAPRSANVTLTLGEQRASRIVEIAPWEETQVIVGLTASSAGETMLQASLQAADEEALRADDTRWHPVRVREGLRVALKLPEGVVTAGEQATWRRVVRSLPWIIPTDDAGASDVLIMAGGGQELGEAAQRVSARGGAIWFRPTTDALMPAVLRENAAADFAAGNWEKRGSLDGNGWRLKVKREDAPLFQLFATGEYGDPVRGMFHERWHAQPAAGPDVLLTYDDGAPALVQSKLAAGGAVWWWNLAMDPAVTSWPAQSAFLPFVAEALLLSRPRETPPLHAAAAPGHAARFVPDRFPDGGRVLLLDGEANEIPVVEDAASGALAYRSRDGLTIGLYQWTLREETLGRDHPLAHTAVNFPKEEMDLRTLSGDAIAFGEQHAAATGAPNWAALRDGIQLWPWLIGTALVLLAMEGLIVLAGRRRLSPAS